MNIPPNVYYSREHGNFYSMADHRGMGMAFWTNWRAHWEKFPASGASSRSDESAVGAEGDETPNTTASTSPEGNSHE